MKIFTSLKSTCTRLSLVGFFLLAGCKASYISKQAPLSLRFLDEYVIPKNTSINHILIGGLSDLTYDGQFFYAVSDHPQNIYQFIIKIKQQKIDTVLFKKAISIKDQSGEAKSLAWDTEGLIYLPKSNRFIVSSEGAINRHKSPFIAVLDSLRKPTQFFSLPSYFLASTSTGPRNNGVFEGLCKSINGNGTWAATEFPLKQDGTTAKLYRTTSPIRFTLFNNTLKKPITQFSYNLGRIRKLPYLPHAMNGISAILAYKPNQFLVLERAFSAGHKSRGIRARLYWVNAENATNTLSVKSLRKKIGKTIIPAKKQLIFDFNSIKKHLTKRIVDNLEGMSWGPTLPNGHRTLVLIADNNFNAFTPELNQVILVEVIPQHTL